MSDAERFDPVVLDLANMDDFIVLTHALEDYASAMDAHITDLREHASHGDDGQPDHTAAEVARWSGLRDRARHLCEAIQGQLEANDAARRRAPGE